MKQLLVLLVASTLLACGKPAPNSTPTPLAAGFDPADLSTEVRAQDDFFDFVNGPWIARTEIPAEYSRYGEMQILQETTEEQLRALIEETTALTDRPAGSDEQKIADLYLSFIDEARADELGVAPLDAELARIDVLENHDQLIEWFGHALKISITVPVNFYVDADATDPDRMLAYLWQDGLGLPDRDYWLEDAENLVAVREKYVAHIERMHELAGWPDGAAAARRIADLEKRLAEIQWTRVQSRDREKIYSNQFTRDQAAELSPGFDWQTLLAAGGFGDPDSFVIAQTDYFAQLGELVREFPMETWREYARFRTLKAFAPYLSADILREDFDFQRRTLRGQEELRPRWKRGVYLVSGGVGEMIGKAYVERHFPPEAKRRVDTMIENLRGAFRDSIESLDWMSDETKAAAQKKLAAFNSKIGYPEVWRDYSALDIVAGDLVGNVSRVREFEHNRHVAKLGKPVDRSEWGMSPQTINAYYRPTWNEIVFPAAILQPPYFDVAVDDAFNYGAIGAIIGHEFSHGFDDQGRKFDGAGRLQDWWTGADAEQYLARSAGIVKQYDAFEPLPGQNVNGKLTLGENIADLAGLVVAYRAWQLLMKGREPAVIDGFGGAERFFIGYGVAWRSKMRDEYLLKTLLSDPHSPPRYRVNGILRNMPEFYEAFDVAEGDGMYLPAEERVKIW
ncbi:MAG: M13 family metallopeptidase [Gammaproteobacteria bacterium]|nr:M13 family metallopeptidase [Gammaproteobacteria bacterium]NND37481.1 M13 family metallopeptidase [Gammaproteobacteria bacterium]